MTDTESSSITLVLPEYVLDVLAHWASADAELMEPGDGRPDRQQLRAQRAGLADDFVRNLLHFLPALSADSDLAAALKLRDLAYAEYRAANPK